ncbi:MAG TPA: TadE family protein [Novosphingobium sp.]|nr:TadE family protein [Novosphingobium sp.]
MLRLLRELRRDTWGTMAVETALVVPVLALLSIGGFEVSAMVARQNELQGAAAEAGQIALAASPDTDAKRATLKNIIVTSTGLPASKVTITMKFRCGATTTLQTTNNCANASDKVSTYVEIYMTDTFVPSWKKFGVGTNMTYRVTRRVMLS